MLKYVFAFILFVHSLIHMMAFARAGGYDTPLQLIHTIPTSMRYTWLLASVLLMVVSLAVVFAKKWWPLPALFAVAISQALILLAWKDAKAGTLINVIIVLPAIAAWATQHFEARFICDVNANLQRSNDAGNTVLTENDIQFLPLPVQKYVRYAGVLHQPAVKNVRIAFDGQMRSKTNNWFRFRSVQYNFFIEPARLFFMKARIFGIPVPGYHHYQNAMASMDVRAAGLFRVVHVSGAEMNKAETVTVFNDMCLMVPASLLDKRITWESTGDPLTAKAIFTNGNNQIAATLCFNETGQLINFISDDRYEVGNMKQYRFSTPVHNYTTLNGIRVPENADAVWHYPEGEYVYGKFCLKSIAYNVKDVEQ